MIKGVSVSTQKRAQIYVVRHGPQRRAKLEGRTFNQSAGRPVEIRSFVTANAIVRAVDREYLEAFQSPATFANWEIFLSSRSYFLLSKVVLAQKKNKSAQNTKD